MNLAQTLRALTMTYKMNRVTLLGRTTPSGASSAVAATGIKRMTLHLGTKLSYLGRGQRSQEGNIRIIYYVGSGCWLSCRVCSS